MKEERPWGWYEVIDQGDRFKVKNIEVKPTAAFFITNTGLGNFDPRDPTNGMLDGHMLSGQLELGLKLDKHKITAASGYYALRDINNVPTTDFFFVLFNQFFHRI